MGLSVKVRYPTIDLAKTEDAIHKSMSEFIVDALRTWVMATTDVVPVLTGASKASFSKLAAEANYQLSITPRGRQNRIQLGVGSFQGGVFGGGADDSYGWSWSSDLDYIHIVDRHNQFLAAGGSALNFVQSPELPAPIIERQN